MNVSTPGTTDKCASTTTVSNSHCTTITGRSIVDEGACCKCTRTVLDVHSTTILCVVFNENKNESRKGIDNIQISQKREMTDDEENK